ncbi:MAG: hypothetical protein ACRBDL_08805 [Alphaproteobacteria bacterium]
MSRKKKIWITLGVIIVLIIVWRMNAVLNTPPLSPSSGNGGVYDEKTGKFYTAEDLQKIREGD